MIKKTIQSLTVLWLMLVCLAATVYAESDYRINGVTVRYDDFTSRPGACRVYAGKLYQKIWGTEFSSDFYDDDNMLRNLEMEELTLTEEHLQAYISQAALGSAFRVSSRRFLHRNDGGAGHTQLIVQKDENGFTVLEGGLTEYPYYREYYYTWSEFVNTHWLGGRYGYIKYIKWPGAPEYDPDYDARAPEISVVEITAEEDYGGFTVTFDASDDVEVREAYVLVWSQGKTQMDGFTVPCTIDGTRASAEVSFDSFENGVRNFYVKCFAVDGIGNSDHTAPQLISLYPLYARFRGYCQVLTEDVPICIAPGETVNGTDTLVYTASRGAYLHICGLYRDENGVRWYQLSDGLWVRERDVRYHTFQSFLGWILDDSETKNISWLDNQLLFQCE